MKCEEVEQDIYGYRELEEKRRNVVDEHVRQCHACAKLFLEMQQQYSVISSAVIQKSQLKNPHRFTDSVMKRIEPSKQIQTQNLLLAIFDRISVRYSLAALSVLLILSFVIEQQIPKLKPEASAIAVVKKDVALNTASFLKNIRGKNSSINSVRITSLYACATVGACDPLAKFHKTK